MIEAYYFEFSAFLIAIYSYKRLKNSFMFWFIPFLLITSVSELASDLIYRNYGVATDWIYNILGPITIYFYGYVFYRLLRNDKLKPLFLIAATLYFILNIFMAVNEKGFHISLFMVGAIIQIILACYFFYRCLLDDVDLNAHQINSGLWIASGILIFFAGVSIVFSLVDYIRAHHLMIHGLPLYKIIPRYLSIILYACISIALLKWKKPQEK